MITTNQKDVLFREISLYLKKYKVKSLLDIGAGDGILAQKLANRVSRYLAIESDRERIEKLRGFGLETIHATFPQGIAGKFDMVLASHSIPEDESLYRPFLETAWNTLNDKGVLLIVTFKGQHGELHDLRNKWRDTKDSDGIDEKLYHAMLNILKTYGKVEIHRVVSEFQSENIDEITDFAIRSISPKESEKEACVQFLRDFFKIKHFSEGKYFFPHEHVFISVSRLS
ncbi:MAG: class I SAM-dependent methyltransferase [Patescibacteria group bacterium]